MLNEIDEAIGAATMAIRKSTKELREAYCQDLSKAEPGKYLGLLMMMDGSRLPTNDQNC